MKPPASVLCVLALTFGVIAPGRAWSASHWYFASFPSGEVLSLGPDALRGDALRETLSDAPPVRVGSRAWTARAVYSDAGNIGVLDLARESSGRLTYTLSVRLRGSAVFVPAGAVVSDRVAGGFAETVIRPGRETAHHFDAFEPNARDEDCLLDCAQGWGAAGAGTAAFCAGTAGAGPLGWLACVAYAGTASYLAQRNCERCQPSTDTVPTVQINPPYQEVGPYEHAWYSVCYSGTVPPNQSVSFSYGSNAVEQGPNRLQADGYCASGFYQIWNNTGPGVYQQQATVCFTQCGQGFATTKLNRL